MGASRLWRALLPATGAGALTLVVNTGDDLWRYGLRICPDLDTTIYALSGMQDPERGWGIAGETWRCIDELRRLGDDVWFNLGDRDLATHLLRTGMLAGGRTLSEVTAALAGARGVAATVLPMTDHEVTTVVTTAGGRRLHYEEFLVRCGAGPEVVAVGYEGVLSAAPAPGVVESITAADVVVIAPSNPVASVGPILAVPGVLPALRSCGAEIVAVTPIVTGAALPEAERRRAASRASLLGSKGIPATATGVASWYRDICHRFVVDSADAGEAAAVADLGLEVTLAGTLVHGGASPDALAGAVLGTLSRNGPPGRAGSSGAGSPPAALPTPRR